MTLLLILIYDNFQWCILSEILIVCDDIWYHGIFKSLYYVGGTVLSISFHVPISSHKSARSAISHCYPLVLLEVKFEGDCSISVGGERMPSLHEYSELFIIIYSLLWTWAYSGCKHSQITISHIVLLIYVMHLDCHLSLAKYGC